MVGAIEVRLDESPVRVVNLSCGVDRLARTTGCEQPTRHSIGWPSNATTSGVSHVGAGKSAWQYIATFPDGKLVTAATTGSGAGPDAAASSLTATGLGMIALS